MNLKSVLLNFIWFIPMLWGCALKPTVVKETMSLDSTKFIVKSGLPQIGENTLVVDARSAFDFNLVHLPGSIPLRFEDLGPLKPNKIAVDQVVRRLSLKGVAPNKEILIVGNGPGPNGRGEESRLAWALLYLGFKNVQVARIENYSKLLTTAASEPRKNEPMWVAPPVRHNWVTDAKKFKEAVTRRLKGSRVVILDVRSSKEYLRRRGSSGPHQTPHVEAMNIEWREFFTEGGWVNPSMKQRLQEVGVQLSDEIFVISDKGERSSSVSWALLQLGFDRVFNYLGGYQDLLSEPSLKGKVQQ